MKATQKRQAFLAGYALGAVELRRLAEEHARWRGLSQALSGGEELRAMERELGRRLGCRKRSQQAVERAVAKVQEEDLRGLLRARYLQGYSWEAVAEACGKSLTWVKMKHEKALGRTK